MYDIAEQVQTWLSERRPVHIAQVVATRGFSSREPGSGVAWTDGATAGSLFRGVEVELSAESGLTEVAVSDDDAAAAGLSCGGVASVLVQPATALPADTWARLMRREPLCLLTELDGLRTRLYTQADVREAADEVARLFARGTSYTALLERAAVVVLWPPTALLVVGDGSIAHALASAAELLGWTATITNEAPAASAAAQELTESDALVVLSHDRAVDVPALEAALRGRAGYVGALGSRGTQAARRDLLSGDGMSDDALARIYGPAGLDVDAHTPAEIAVSIVAEILAARSGSRGGSIRDRKGPVHT